MSNSQYLLVMAACVVATLPLEVLFGARVWRRPRRLVKALAVPVVVFVGWDIAAIAHHQWRFDRRYIIGVYLPGRLPIEEVVFFVVVPICALLTFEVVTRMLGPDRDVPWPGRLVPALATRPGGGAPAEAGPPGETGAPGEAGAPGETVEGSGPV
jgi:lycopene cyclase domain-containing protein